jgi:hypothetical protein
MLFLEQIEQRLQQGEKLRYACYEVSNRCLLYRPGQLVVLQEHEAPAQLLRFVA